MNTNNISQKIVYSKYIDLNYLAPREFIHYAKKCGFFNEITFLDYFKDRGLDFWYNVIFLSNLNIDFLFKRYEEEMINPRLYKRIKESTNKEFGIKFSEITKALAYICKYEKNKKIDIQIEIK